MRPADFGKCPEPLEGPGGELERSLAEKVKAGRKLLVVYVTGGLPDAATFPRLLEEIAASGADLIEVGIPFSDPVMDGPVIQEASKRALDSGVTPESVLQALGESEIGVPVAVMTYYNLVHHRGLERFAREAASAGVGGVILPDLPLEESADWEVVATRCGIATILLAAPNATDERLEEVARRSRGFVYGVSLLGVTGVRDSLAATAGQLGTRLTKISRIPVALGIGISTPSQAAEAAEHADGVVIGSAAVQILLSESRFEDAIARLGELVGEVRVALDQLR